MKQKSFILFILCMESYICKKVGDIQERNEDPDKSFILSNKEYNDELFKNVFSSLKNTLLVLCVLSKLIYEHDDEHFINVLLKNWGLEYEITTSEDGMVYGLFYTEEYLILIFKGTSSLSDMLYNINFIQTNDDFNIPGKLHRGFESLILENNVAYNIKLKMDGIIKERGIKNERVYISGHSLGGALAGIFCCYYVTRDEEEKFPQLVTFGAPRSGDKEFSKVIERNSIRVVNGHDIVTSIPIFGYKHFQKFFHVGSYLSFRLISDHHLSRYYKELIKLQD